MLLEVYIHLHSEIFIRANIRTMKIAIRDGYKSNAYMYIVWALLLSPVALRIFIAILSFNPREDLPYVPLKTKVSPSLHNLLARLKVQEEEEKAKGEAKEKEEEG